MASKLAEVPLIKKSDEHLVTQARDIARSRYVNENITIERALFEEMYVAIKRMGYEIVPANEYEKLLGDKAS